MIAAVRASGPVIIVCWQVGQVRVLCRVLVAGCLGWVIVSCVFVFISEFVPSLGRGALPLHPFPPIGMGSGGRGQLRYRVAFWEVVGRGRKGSGKGSHLGYLGHGVSWLQVFV